MSSIFAPYKTEGRQMCVGYFFDRLARHLLHHKLLSKDEWLATKSADHFDIEDWNLQSLIEIKGASNMDQLKLFADQLDAQMEEIGFPLDRAIVLIFSYRNYTGKGGREKRTRLLLKHRKSYSDLAGFLANHVNIAYAVDIRLIAAHRKQNGTKAYKRDLFAHRRRVSMTRSDLRIMANDTRSALSELGFSDEIGSWLPPRARAVRSRIISTELDGNHISFELVPLLPNVLKRKFIKQLNGSVRSAPRLTRE